MGNNAAQPLHHESDDCYSTTKIADPFLTSNQMEILLNSPFSTDIFLRDSKIIKDPSIPIEVNNRWYFWDNYKSSTSGNWNTCSMRLTPQTWSYGNGSFAKTVDYGCNIIETCCEAGCCRIHPVTQVLLVLAFLVMMYLLYVCHFRLFRVTALLKTRPPPRVQPSAPRLSSSTELRPVTIPQRRQSPLYLQVPVEEIQTPSVRNIPIPIPISDLPLESSDEEGNEEGEPPKYSDLFPMCP